MKPACRRDVGDKAATRLLMDLRGKDIQTDDAFLHDDHPVGDGHDFGLVVGHIQIGKYRSWKPRQASACSGYSTRIIIGIHTMTSLRCFGNNSNLLRYIIASDHLNTKCNIVTSKQPPYL